MADKNPDETFDKTFGSILEPDERIIYDSFMVKPTKASRKRGLVLYATLGGPFMILLFGIKYGLTPYMIGLGIAACFYFLQFRTRTVLTDHRIIYTEGRKYPPRSWQLENIRNVTRYGNKAWAWFKVHIGSDEQIHTSHLPKAQSFWDSLPATLRDPRSDELTRKCNIMVGTYGVILGLSILPLWITVWLLPIHILQSLEVCPEPAPKELFYSLLIGGLPLSFLVGSVLSGLLSTMAHRGAMSRSEARFALTDGFHGTGNSILGRLIRQTVVRPLDWTVGVVYGPNSDQTNSD